MAAPPLPNLLPGTPCIELLTATLCGHTSIAANCPGKRMLLPLCGIARPRRLCKVVRFEAICLPLAGNEVRETAHAYTGQQLKRRPEIPAPRPCRACPAPSVVFSLPSSVMSGTCSDHFFLYCRDEGQRVSASTGTRAMRAVIEFGSPRSFARISGISKTA